MQKPTQALQSVKGLGYTFDLNPKWERTMPSFDICLWVINRAPQIQISKECIGTAQGIFRGEQRGAWHCVCVPGSYIARSDPDRKWRHMKSRDGKWRHNRKYVLHAFFLTIEVVRNVQLGITGSSMANGCDMNGSHVTGSEGTGSDVIFPALFSYYSISIKCIIAHDRK